MNTQYNQQGNLLGFIVVGILIAAIIAMSSLFIVDQNQQAIVLRFGKPVKEHVTPGLKVKMPWPFEDVTYFEKRILDVDLRPETVNLSSERGNPLIDAARKTGAAEPVADVAGESGGMPIIVNTYVRYRIESPLQFLQRLGSEAVAENRIETLTNGTTMDVLGKATLAEILSPRRTALMETIKQRVNTDMRQRGVQIVDIRIIRADLPDKLEQSTVARMITERQEQATETRSNGQGKATQIRAGADRERTEILAEAQRDAQALRGEGDNAAIKIYADSLKRDPQFFSFWRTMEAYRTALASSDTNLVLSPDSAFLRYLKSAPQSAPVSPQ